MKTDFKEIDEGTGYIGYREALGIIEANVRRVGDEALSLNRCVGRIAASDRWRRSAILLLMCRLKTVLPFWPLMLLPPTGKNRCA